MVRIGKRNFSLRDSPDKLLLVSSSPRQAICQQSPVKRLKIVNTSHILSSTLLEDVRVDEEPPVLVEPGRAFGGAEREMATPLNGTTTTVSATAETPPPTPDTKPKSRFELLSERKSKLEQQSKELDSQLDSKLLEILSMREKISQIHIRRLTYHDYLDVANKGQNEMRDLLNEIFNPGNELAKQAERITSELQLKHMRRFDKLELDLNSLIDRTKKAIEDEIISKLHEIDLHQRTLTTREQQNQSVVEISVQSQELEQKAEMESGEANVSDRENGVDKDAQYGDEEDCVILDASGDNSVSNDEESAIANSTNMSEERTTHSDEDDTDIEESLKDDARSFTPCQAQRPQ